MFLAHRVLQPPGELRACLNPNWVSSETTPGDWDTKLFEELDPDSSDMPDQRIPRARDNLSCSCRAHGAFLRCPVVPPLSCRFEPPTLHLVFPSGTCGRKWYCRYCCMPNLNTIQTPTLTAFVFCNTAVYCKAPVECSASTM